ncbi:hemerythrin domain-containing protein [Sulfurimonas sp.]
MLSFLKKSNKKDKNMPDYESGLIKKFHKDHKKLIKHIGNIQNAVKAGKDAKAKGYLQDLKVEMLSHFMEEDIKLYWYLKSYYKDVDGAMQTIHMFEESIKKIQRSVIDFLDKYAESARPLDATFKQGFDEIVTALATRITTEEESLYTLYKK